MIISPNRYTDLIYKYLENVTFLIFFSDQAIEIVKKICLSLVTVAHYRARILLKPGAGDTVTLLFVNLLTQFFNASIFDITWAALAVAGNGYCALNP